MERGCVVTADYRGLPLGFHSTNYPFQRTAGKVEGNHQGNWNTLRSVRSLNSKQASKGKTQTDYWMIAALRQFVLPLQSKTIR